jgi:hypothetical protein
MFLSKTPRMSDRVVARLLQDTERVKAMLLATSSFLASVLAVKEEGGRFMPPPMPLVTLCREEILHFPNRARLEQMLELNRAYAFVVSSENVACALHDAACAARGHNMNMDTFAAHDCYYYDDEVHQAGARLTRIPVGGLFNKLVREVFARAYRWLGESDAVLCAAAEIGADEGVTRQMEDVKQTLAAAIARRVCLEDMADVTCDDLSSRALEQLMQAEAGRGSAHGQRVLTHELAGVVFLETLARAPRSAEARRILQQELPILDHLVAHPPFEIEAVAGFVRLDLLARSIEPSLDVEVRVALASFWAQTWGAGAAAALSSAAKQMREWQPAAAVPFSTRIKEFEKGDKFVLPRMSFLHSDQISVFAGLPKRRHGMDERGLRSTRLVQLVWELAAKWVFLPGMIAAEAVEPVALDSIICDRMAAAAISTERQLGNKGVRLRNLIAELHNLEGDHKRAIQCACCDLSRFSCLELEAVFHSSGKILPVVYPELTRLARERMTVSVHPKYKSFATDALAFLVPILELERSRAGMETDSFSHPLVDLLLSVPRAASWSPLDGSLVLTLEDLKLGHRDTRMWLDRLHDAGVLVSRKGAGKESRKNKKIAYHFDTCVLKQLAESWEQKLAF